MPSLWQHPFAKAFDCVDHNKLENSERDGNPRPPNLGIYLEDLYVKPEYRGRGYGKGLLNQLAKIAVERGCGRLEWWCLDWNHPSIDFYLSLDAEPMTDWTVYRIAGKTLTELAQ